MILLLDNYDSFTYNLQQYLEELSGERIQVARNDEISIEKAATFDTIVFSPGPGLPEESGLMMPMIKAFSGSKHLLGICLGHQAITLAFGGRLKNLEKVLHGVVRPVHIRRQEHPLFTGIPSPFEAGRYHSWVPDRDGFPKELEVLGGDDHDEIMILGHRQWSVFGFQFHPESVMTPSGKQLLGNWLRITGRKPVYLR